jgi:hypothetical protein
MRYEDHNLDGRGWKRTPVYDMPVVALTLAPGTEHEATYPDYWASVTDVPCPATPCAGRVQWAEAGYVPGYRICDTCGRHYLAKGTVDAPTLVRCGTRRSKVGDRAEEGADV